MKQKLSILTAAALLVCLCGCGGSAGEAIADAAVASHAPVSAQPAVTPTPTPTPAPEPEAYETGEPTLWGFRVGYYTITTMASGGSTLAGGLLNVAGIDGTNTYVRILEDGAGVTELPGATEPTAFTWDEAELTLENGEVIPYTLDNDMLVLTLEDGGETVTLTFAYAGETAPESEEEGMSAAGAELETQGDVGDYYLKIVGAESFDDDGKTGIRFYYDLTNNSDKAACAWLAIIDSAFQDGRELESTWTFDDPEEIDNKNLYIMPGITIRCASEYTFDPGRGPVEFRLADLWESVAVFEVFDPEDLPGPPAEANVIAPIADPEWIKGLSDETETVKLLRCEFSENYFGEPLIRIYYQFTNTTDEAASFLAELNVQVMQDGVELTTTFSLDDVPEEDNYFTEVEPGASIVVAESYLLRSDSPVTVTAAPVWTEGETAGALYPVS